MNTQIAVRLPDALVAFPGREVAHGHASSRAELVTKALRRMERERIAARDLEVIIASGGNPYSELEGMLEQLVGTYPGIDQCVRFIWWHWTRFVRYWC
jgi:Arc/MetJ-type ribon-helix-helix transcriptional regulator